MYTDTQPASHRHAVPRSHVARRRFTVALATAAALAVSTSSPASMPQTSGYRLYHFNPTTAVVVWSGLRRHITTLDQISAELGQPLSEANYDRLGRPTQFTFQFPLEGSGNSGSPASSAAGRVANAVMHDVKRRLIHRGISAIFARFGGTAGGLANDAVVHMENQEAMASLPTPSEQQGQPPFTTRRYPGYHWVCVFTFSYRGNTPVVSGVQPACSPMP